MRLLITGGAGFVGLNLIQRLTGAGHRLTIADIATDAVGRLRAAGHRGPRLLGPRGDIRDLEACQRMCAGQDAVVNLAALPGVEYSRTDPRGCLATNALGPANLATAAQAAGVERLVLISSAAADRPASSPYALSKALVERYAAWWAQAELEPAVIAIKPSNLYGPWCGRKDSVIPRWLRLALAGRPLLVEGDGSTTRDFLFVGDACAAIEAALEVPADRLRQAPQGTIAIGSGTATTLLELHRAIQELEPSAAAPERLPARENDAAAPPVDFRAARDLLGWHPATNLREGLQQTSEWLRRAAARGGQRG